MTPKQIITLGASLILFLMVSVVSCSGINNVDAGEIVVHQEALSGELKVWNTPGWKFSFGTNTSYQKSGEFVFPIAKDSDGNVEKDADGNPVVGRCIKTGFNDQGTAHICGQASFDLPSDPEAMKVLHTKFRNMEAIRDRLVKASIVKAIYNSGPLMSSRDSASKRRSDLIAFIQDMATQGVYKTVSNKELVDDLTQPPLEVVEMVDSPVLNEKGQPVLGDDGNPVMEKKANKMLKPRQKTVSIVEPLVKDGKIQVQEQSAATEYGIRLYNITIEQIVYEPKIQEQINNQRDMEMQIQTKIAEAEKAKQDAITVEQKGIAEAAQAKWAQEKVKAQKITEAEQKKEVARLDLESAELERKARIERAKGEAESKKLVMDADGALEKKLDAYIAVNRAYAAEIGKQRWVPEVQMGGASSSGGDSVHNLMQLFQAKTAKDLALDMKVK